MLQEGKGEGMDVVEVVMEGVRGEESGSTDRKYHRVRCTSVYACMCVCDRERERERSSAFIYACTCIRVSVYVSMFLYLYMFLCVRVLEMKI